MRRDQRGSVLILSMWALALLAAFAFSMAGAARQKATLLNRIQTRTALQDAAQSGIERSRGLLAQLALMVHDGPDTLVSDWASNSAHFKEIKTGPAVASVKCAERFGLCDEGGKIDLNKADVPTLTRLFELAGGIDRGPAEEIAYAVVDWRDGDSAFGHPQFGAEDSDYRDQRLSYEAKDAPFETVDELLLVKGVTREIFDRIMDKVTPASSSGVNLHTAPREVLLAVGLSEKLADKVLEYRRGPDGLDGTADDVAYQRLELIEPTLQLGEKLDGVEVETLSRLVGTGAIGISSNFFTAQVTAVSNVTGASLSVQALISREGKVKFVRWGEIKWR